DPPTLQQAPGADFEGGEMASAAICCGVPELYTCAPAGTAPLARCGVVELKVHSGRIVLKALGNPRQHLLVRQQRPPFLVMNVKLVLAGRSPGQSICIEQSRVSRQGISQHERSIEENETFATPNFF